ELEKYGVQFLRFSNEDVLRNMFSVSLSIEETVKLLLE
ncbi:MAG TPA: DNA methylase, partial [Flavobacteriaceae bacterium]|nr:DNA methylase [Flavobacteriaceae bacterium]